MDDSPPANVLILAGTALGHYRGFMLYQCAAERGSYVCWGTDPRQGRLGPFTSTPALVSAIDASLEPF